MIYTFRIISGETDHFIREIEIDSHCLFLDFHEYLNSEMNFDKEELASFFITDQDWQKEREITLLNMMEDQEPTILTMGETKLEDMITGRKQRLLYVFDLFAERTLFLELTQIKEGALSEPCCIRREGEPPPAFKAETLEGPNIEGPDEIFPDPFDEEDPFKTDDPGFIDLDEDLY